MEGKTEEGGLGSSLVTLCVICCCFVCCSLCFCALAGAGIGIGIGVSNAIQSAKAASYLPNGCNGETLQLPNNERLYFNSKDDIVLGTQIITNDTGYEYGANRNRKYQFPYDYVVKNDLMSRSRASIYRTEYVAFSIPQRLNVFTCNGSSPIYTVVNSNNFGAPTEYTFYNSTGSIYAIATQLTANGVLVQMYDPTKTFAYGNFTGPVFSLWADFTVNQSGRKFDSNLYAVAIGIWTKIYKKEGNL